jgi:GNAT superfamily N-acetyltransferase
MISPATSAVVEEVWSQRWGLPVVTTSGSYRPHDVEGLVLRSSSGEVMALVTWIVSGAGAEIVSLDALTQGRGLGTRLLAAAEDELRARGVRHLWLVTTSDNLSAFGFYIRRGYRLVGVHLDSMERVREVKPDLPMTGDNDLPLRDMWELEKDLSPRPEGRSGS